ncbi:MAG TPA: hypothetical protein VHV77_00480, partial [Pirellulales bacterium]|nr:hypothetical protein [Pirellulales bacterium]
MSRRRPPAPLWPFLLALACLLVLAVTSPRGWEQLARRSPLIDVHKRATRESRAAVPQDVAMAEVKTRPASASISTIEPLDFTILTPAPAAEVTRPTVPPHVTERPQRPVAATPTALVVTTPIDEPKPLAGPTPIEPVRPRATEAREKVRWWPLPGDLLAELDQLSRFPEARRWAERVRATAIKLADVESPNDPRATELLNELEDLAAEQNAILPLIPEGPRATSFRRAGLALIRRIDVWQYVPLWTATEIATPGDRKASGDALRHCLVDLEAKYASQPDSRWPRYLMLDSLKQLAAHGETAPSDEWHRVAGLVLGRLERAGITSRTETQNNPLARLYGLLRPWASGPIDPRRVVFDIEQFESSGLPSDARLVADDYRRLAWADGELQQELAAALASHYRNANLRVTISVDLMNRLVQEQPPRGNYVSDNVLGNPTRGWSTTSTDVAIRLIPDSQRARLLLEARGHVAADTVTTASIVKLRSQSDSAFLATKELDIGLSGLHSRPAWADAETVPRLRSIQTDLDLIPVLGLVMQSVAEMSYEDNQPRARFEAKRKLSQRVREQMDQELAARIEEANGKFRDSVLQPLANLDLTPELVEAQTTEQR